MQFDVWVYLIAVVGDTNEQENFFCCWIRSHLARFCFQPIYVLTCFELFCLPFSMFVPYFRSSEISWRKKLHHKVTVPFHIYMTCIYGTFHSYSFRAIFVIYLLRKKKSSSIWDLRNMMLLIYNYLYNLYFHPLTKNISAYKYFIFGNSNNYHNALDGNWIDHHLCDFYPE